MRRIIVAAAAVLLAVPATGAEAATVGGGAFGGSFTYQSPTLVVGPNCVAVSPEFSGSAFPVLVNNDVGVTVFAGQVNVFGIGSSPCANFLAESGSITLDVAHAAPSVGTLFCDDLAGGYGRTPGYFTVHVRGVCELNGVSGVPMRFTIAGGVAPVETGCCPEIVRIQAYGALEATV